MLHGPMLTTKWSYAQHRILNECDPHKQEILCCICSPLVCVNKLNIIYVSIFVLLYEKQNKSEEWI